MEDCHINCPRACYRVLQRLLDLGSDAVEKFGILALNAQNQIVGLHIVGIGSLDAVYVHPREVFKAVMGYELRVAGFVLEVGLWGF